MFLHGFTDTWRSWELVLPALERRHDHITTRCEHIPADVLAWVYSTPRMSSSTTVMIAETTSDPRQPRRFEKNRNKGSWVYPGG